LNIEQNFTTVTWHCDR